MKVLLANKFFYRNGGSEVVMFQERDFLIRSGHQVIDFSMHDERNLGSAYSSHFVGQQDYRGGNRFGRLRSALSLMHSPEAVRKIGALIDKTKPDLVHCHNIYHQLTPSIIGAAKARGVPVTLTLHDSKPVCPAYLRLSHGRPCSDCLSGGFSRVLKNRCADGSFGKSALLYVEAIVQRWLGSYEKVDQFLAPSQFMQDSVLHRFPAKQVTLLANGVDIGTIRTSSQDDDYVLYLGRLSPEKGVDTLLRAHADARGAWPLVVAGAGPMADALKMQYSSAKFAGHLSGAALRQAISNASAVVLPSECFENSPMSVLEAMAHGKPVVGSRMGGIPELVSEGETGLLFEAGNADELRGHLDALMASPTMRRAMGHRARLRVEQQFSLEKHNAALMDIYESLVNSK